MKSMPAEIASRFIRTLIRCPVCNKPIGERLGNKWWFEKYSGGKKSKILQEQNQNTPQGDYKMHCSDKDCKGACIFAWVNEKISIVEKVYPQLKVDDANPIGV